MDLEVFRENIKPVREWLAAGAPRVNIGLYTDVGFNMADFISETEPDLDVKDHAGNECGTACCIAGYLALLLRRCGERGPASTLAQYHLGLDDYEAEQLFMGLGYNHNRALDEITPAEALAVIDHAIETGVIDWRVANRV